jgi:hypothetical protein
VVNAGWLTFLTKTHYDDAAMEDDPPARRPTGVRTCQLLLEMARLKHYMLYIDRKCSLFFARRTTAPFDHIEEVEACFKKIELLLKDIPRKHYSLLVDARKGALRNDPAFEAALSKHRGKLLFGFAKNAALTATASGQLQIKRFARNDGRSVFATSDPAAAFEYLGLPFHEL